MDGHMRFSGEAMSLRIFLSEGDVHEGKPLYENIVMKARELHLAGATATRGVLGFGAHSRVHTAKLLRLSDDLPVIVEIIDEMNNLNKILPFIKKTVKSGMVTLEKIRVVQYSHGEE